MTITLTREEAQQVLDALEGSIDAQEWEINDHVTKYGEWYRPKRVEWMKQQLANTNNTIETLRARLAQPEPEPQEAIAKWIKTNTEHREWYICPKCSHQTPRFKNEWQGLTEEEKREIFDSCEREDRGYVAAMVEAKLKEKNNG
jgi:hypothetical protein